MLDGAGHAARDVEGRRHDLARLPHLMLVADPAGVHRGARCAQRGAQLGAQRAQHGPALGPLDSAPAGHDLVGLGHVDLAGLGRLDLHDFGSNLQRPEVEAHDFTRAWSFGLRGRKHVGARRRDLDRGGRRGGDQDPRLARVHGALARDAAVRDVERHHVREHRHAAARREPRRHVPAHRRRRSEDDGRREGGRRGIENGRVTLRREQRELRLVGDEDFGSPIRCELGGKSGDSRTGDDRAKRSAGFLRK